MARPQSGMDTSQLPKLKIYRPISDQTYYLYFRKLVRAFQQWKAAEEVGDTALTEENAKAINAIQQRLEEAERPVPTYEDLVLQGKIKLREKEETSPTQVNLPHKEQEERAAPNKELLEKIREINRLKADSVSSSNGN